MKSQNKNRKLVGFVAVLALALSAGMAAAADGQGLGARWPMAPDVSRSAAFHAYNWVSNGVRYVQVNGADGTPLMAIATAHGQVLALPIGQAQVSVQRVTSLSAPQSGQVVFSDGLVDVSQTGGGFTVRAADEAPCSDPVECSKPQVTTRALPVATMQAQDTCSDPVECSKP